MEKTEIINNEVEVKICKSNKQFEKNVSFYFYIYLVYLILDLVVLSFHLCSQLGF